MLVLVLVHVTRKLPEHFEQWWLPNSSRQPYVKGAYCVTMHEVHSFNLRVLVWLTYFIFILMPSFFVSHLSLSLSSSSALSQYLSLPTDSPIHFVWHDYLYSFAQVIQPKVLLLFGRHKSLFKWSTSWKVNNTIGTHTFWVMMRTHWMVECNNITG